MGKHRNKIAVFNVTPKCNLNCAFCFGPDKGEKELLNVELKSLIDNAKTENIQKVVFTGGEPLLREDIFELIDYAKKKGMYTILHTNGLLLDKAVIAKLENNLDQINLPLDGHNNRVNDGLRTPGHFGKIFKCLSLLKNLKIRIIISTVTNSKNIESVLKIGGILLEHIYKWRVFQFKPEGKAEKVKSEYEISDEEFNEICENIKKKKYSFKVQCVGRDNKFSEIYYVA